MKNSERLARLFVGGVVIAIILGFVPNSALEELVAAIFAILGIHLVISSVIGRDPFTSRADTKKDHVDEAEKKQPARQEKKQEKKTGIKSATRKVGKEKTRKTRAERKPPKTRSKKRTRTKKKK